VVGRSAGCREGVLRPGVRTGGRVRPDPRDQPDPRPPGQPAEPGKLFVSRQLRLLCSWRTRVSWIPVYGIDRSSAADRAAYLARAEAAAVRLGRRSAERSR
jgi:hypothetical protein